MYLWCIYQALVGADNMTTIATPHLLLYPRVVLDTARDICPCPVLLDPSELVLSLLVVKCYWSVMAEVWRIKCATSEFYGCLWCRRSPLLWSRRTYHSALSKIHLHQLPRIHFQNTLSWLTLTVLPGFLEKFPPTMLTSLSCKRYNVLLPWLWKKILWQN